MPLAALDIGSNAIRFRIGGDDTEQADTNAAHLRIPMRLGDDAFRHGRIGEATAASFLDVMGALASLMRAYGVTRYRACATSALRDAANGRELAARAARLTGLVIDIIDGMEEARILFEAQAFGETPQGNALYMDVGGGSVEVAVLNGEGLPEAYSFRLGTARALAGVASPEERQRFRNALSGLGRAYAPCRCLISGGNSNGVARLLARRLGRPVGLEDLRALREELSRRSAEEIRHSYGLSPRRARTLDCALELFLEAVRLTGARQVAIPGMNMVNGLLHHMRCHAGGKGDASRPWPPEGNAG